MEKYPGCIVADPTRWDFAETIAKDDEEREEITEHRKNSIGVKDEIFYPSQVAWESDHMKMASEKGTLIFWMEKESKVDPRPKEEGVYAQDTRVEIGMWMEKLQNNPNLSIKVGGDWEIDERGFETENSFGGMNFIAYYITKEKDRRKLYNGGFNNPHFVLAKNLEEFFEKVFLSE